MATITPQEQIIALFNAKNASLAHPLVVADVSFGAVATYAPADGSDTRNSKLTVTAKDDSAYFSGSKELHYTRKLLALAAIESTNTATIDWNDSSYVLGVLNAELVKVYPNDAFTAEDFSSGLVSSVRTNDGNGVPKTVVFSIKGTHLKWLASDNILTVNIAAAKTDLSATNGELDGFTE